MVSNGEVASNELIPVDGNFDDKTVKGLISYNLSIIKVLYKFKRITLSTIMNCFYTQSTMVQVKMTHGNRVRCLVLACKTQIKRAQASSFNQAKPHACIIRFNISLKYFVQSD